MSIAALRARWAVGSRLATVVLLTEGNDLRVVPASFREPQQIPGRHARCGAHEKRVTVHLGMVCQRLVHDNGRQIPRTLVDEGLWRNGPPMDAENRFQKIRVSDAEAAEPEPLGQGLEIDLGILLGHDQDHVAVLVFEKEILRVRAGELASQDLRLFDGEHRRVRYPLLSSRSSANASPSLGSGGDPIRRAGALYRQF